MTSHTLYRLGGLSLLMAFVLQVAGWLMHPSGEHLDDLLTPLQGTSHLTLYVSWLLAMLGLPALYLIQAERAGRLGLVAFVAIAFAVGYHCYLLLYEAYPAVWLARHDATKDLIATGGPLAHGAGALGPLGFLSVLAFPLLGIATLRAGVLPRWTGWLQIAGLVVTMGIAMAVPEDTLHDKVPGPFQPIAFLYYLAFAAWAGGGYQLWAGSRQTAHRPQPAAVRQSAT